MTLSFDLAPFSIPVRLLSTNKKSRLLTLATLMACCLAGLQRTEAQAKPAPDELVLSNGDTLHGTLVSSADGKITFHSDPLGDVTLGWDKVKELHTNGKFAVLDKNANVLKKKEAAKIPLGTVEMSNQSIAVHPANAPALAPIPVANAQFIVDEAALDQQLHHRPGFFAGWNGAATAGGSLVAATQNQYTFSGGLGIVRIVPTVTWLRPQNRTSAAFTGSFGKITDPAYTIPATPVSPPVFVPEVTTKSALFHAEAERDQYLTPRFYGLVQIAYDHNYAQNLNLQQIYGGGFGWTFLKKPKQEADLKGTIQYERRSFISGGSADDNLIGSTFALDYVLHEKFLTFTQGIAFIPAYNDTSKYSANEINTLAFPVYKNFSFSVGTLDSYLNNTPDSLPPTKRNSFQFTMGLTYAFKSKY
jgi:hypothetical protein